MLRWILVMMLKMVIAVGSGSVVLGVFLLATKSKRKLLRVSAEDELRKSGWKKEGTTGPSFLRSNHLSEEERHMMILKAKTEAGKRLAKIETAGKYVFVVVTVVMLVVAMMCAEISI